jgi:hypothetical protein
MKIYGTLANAGSNEAVLIASPTLADYPDALPSGKGFNVRLHLLDEVTYLLIEKKNGADVSLFSAMIFDVFSSLKSPDLLPERALVDRMMLRVKAWQEFMKKGSARLSTEYELGLIGELQCISDMLLLGSNAEEIVNRWLGPFRGVQDFIFEIGAIEVKSTASPDSFVSKINSLEQLDEFLISPLYLLGYRLRETSNGATLNDNVETVRKLLANDEAILNKFNSSILASGYLDQHKPEYITKYEKVELLIWKIGPEFPKISSTNTHSSVVKATYSIDLNQIPRDDIIIDRMLVSLGVK